MIPLLTLIYIDSSHGYFEIAPCPLLSTVIHTRAHLLFAWLPLCCCGGCRHERAHHPHRNPRLALLTCTRNDGQSGPVLLVLLVLLVLCSFKRTFIVVCQETGYDGALAVWLNACHQLLQVRQRQRQGGLRGLNRRTPCHRRARRLRSVCSVCATLPCTRDGGGCGGDDLFVCLRCGGLLPWVRPHGMKKHGCIEMLP